MGFEGCVNYRLVDLGRYEEGICPFLVCRILIERRGEEL